MHHGLSSLLPMLNKSQSIGKEVLEVWRTYFLFSTVVDPGTWTEFQALRSYPVYDTSFQGRN